MGIRFRKSIKICKGVRLNLSKSGISYTIGTKGASINTGKNGTYLNTGIPGTGIYSRERLDAGTRQSAPPPAEPEDWEQQARAHGWIPPEAQDAWRAHQREVWEQEAAPQPEEKSHVFRWMVVAAVISFLLIRGTGREAKPSQWHYSTTPTKAAATEPTVLPGSVQEAIRNGTLTYTEIRDRAAALGWSTSAWREWYYVASQTGTTMEAIEAAAKTVNQQLADGDPEFLAALAEIGITEKDAKAMAPEDLFDKVIGSLQSTKD